jgi:hypothetical protein
VEAVMKMRVKKNAGRGDSEFFNPDMEIYRGKIIPVKAVRDSVFSHRQTDCTDNDGRGWWWKATWLEQPTEFTNEEML